MQNSGKKIAFLAANGVDETLMSAIQRIVTKQDIPMMIEIVSTEKALIQTWNGTDWGFSLAVHQKVDLALSADYEAMIISGSQRSLDKLAMNPHSKRFIEGFHASQKPIIAANEAVAFIKDVLLVNDADHFMMIEDIQADATQDEAQKILDFVSGMISDMKMAA